MNRFEMACRVAQNQAIQSLDFSMFSDRDVANVAIQRSEVIQDIPGNADALRAWARGEDDEILEIAREHAHGLLTRAAATVFLEYREQRALLRDLDPRRVADLGCGYGFFSLFAMADLKAEVLLIDTEVSASRHLKFSETGTGCSDLNVARQFLEANGRAPSLISTINPEEDDLPEDGDIDLAVSLLACGFNFPVENYLDFLTRSVRPGGSVLLDIRTRMAPQMVRPLAGLGELTRVGNSAGGKALRMHLVTRDDLRAIAA